MKILIVFNHPAPYKVALFNGLAKEHDVHVIFERYKARNRNKNFYNEANYKFTLHKIKGIGIGNENHLSWGVVKHLKKHKYDLIIMNGYSTFTEMLALRYLKRNNIPYAFYINGGLVAHKESKLYKKIKTYFISGARYYFSPALKANEYLEYYGAPKELIFNYPYSTVYEKDIVETAKSTEQKRSYWDKLKIEGENFTICITSFIKRKNNLSLIKAWDKVDTKHALILVGEGKEEKLYRHYIKEHGLQNVFMLPFAPKKQVFEYLSYSDNAIYISNYDIYGHVINEALAHGLNVLTNTNMVAAHYAIKNGENGFVMQKGENINDYINKLFESNFFDQARESAVTIEDSIDVHLKILGEKL